MNLREFENLKKVEEEQISVLDLVDRQNRTLIYGYTVDRYDFHLYLYDDSFFLLIYSGNNIIKKEMYIDTINDEDCIPDKRVYPEQSDYEFCELLIRNGNHIPFTTFNENIELKKFYGKKLFDFPNRNL